MYNSLRSVTLLPLPSYWLLSKLEILLELIVLESKTPDAKSMLPLSEDEIIIKASKQSICLPSCHISISYNSSAPLKTSSTPKASFSFPPNLTFFSSVFCVPSLNYAILGRNFISLSLLLLAYSFLWSQLRILSPYYCHRSTSYVQAISDLI